MECLDANVVQDLMAGALDPRARIAAIEHLDGCDECRQLIGALAREASRQVAAETLSDPPGQLDPLSATVAADTSELDDGLGATGLPGEATLDSVTKPVRIRARSGIGQTLGRYTITGRLGAGAMGVVYSAEDRELGRAVALKQLHRPDQALTDRLVREARSMAQVNHPNVVAVYDVGITEGITYIAMELVEGQSLRAWLGVDGRTIPERVAAFVAAGQGLAAAHAAGIVHRDFKPDNALVGNDGRVRVTDFGLAASRRDSEPAEASGAAASRSIADVNLTTSGSVLGTPAYMAPEQFTGGHVDARTDQFNFCVSLYEALYGERPFAGQTFDEVSRHVCDGEIRPAPVGSKISTALRAIVVRGLAVRPGDRFASMGELTKQLGRDRARPWRRTAVVAAGVAVVLALGLVSDWAIRDRVRGEISLAFAATARQTDRAVRLLAQRFDAMSNQVYSLAVMRDVTGHHDQADFGLGERVADDADLQEIHDKLVSADWKYAREVAGTEHPATLAVADAKGRLLYTSAAPDVWKTDLIQLPWIKRSFDAGTGNSMTLMRYDDPQLVATRVLGPQPPRGLAVLFTRTVSVGDTPRSQYLQIVSARQLLDDIRLDDDTRLSLVALDGSADGDVPAEVVRAGGDHDGFQVQVVPLANPLVRDGEPIGRLVMARQAPRVLALFPHARAVFAVAMIAALVLALVTALRARQVTAGVG